MGDPHMAAQLRDRILAIEVEARATRRHHAARPAFMGPPEGAATCPMCGQSLAHERSAARAAPLDVDVLIEAVSAMSVPAKMQRLPSNDWISVSVVLSILRGDHPLLARLSEREPMSTNEAAERLRQILRRVQPDEEYSLDEALAHERSAGAAPLDDERAVKTLIDHQRQDAGSCICGWLKWGASHAEHQWRMLQLATRFIKKQGLSAERSAGAAPLDASGHQEGTPCTCDLCRELRVIRRYAEGTDR